MDLKKKIGQRLKAARTAIDGFTLAEVETQTRGKIKASTLGNYEQGIRTPGPEEILILAKVLNKAPAYLMCLEDTGAGLSEKEGKLLKAFRVLPEEMQQKYLDGMDIIASAYKAPVPDAELTHLSAKSKRLKQT